MKLIDINFGNLIGNSLNFRNKEELEKLVELFAKKLKLRKYSYYIYNLSIYIRTAKFTFDISEKRTNQFIIVKEDDFNNRQYSYMQLVNE